MALGVFAAISDHDILEGVLLWLCGSWAVGALIASFTKGGGKFSSLVLNVFSGILASIGLSRTGDGFFAFVFTIILIKAIIGIMILSVLLLVEFLAYPFTTIFYLVKSR